VEENGPCRLEIAGETEDDGLSFGSEDVELPEDVAMGRD
jgi:hypothetical protein